MPREQTLPKRHGARKATGTQMLRSNRDDAFVGDASPVTKPGTLVKFAGATAASDLNNFYNGLKHSRYGANNGHLKDVTPKGQYKTVTTSKAQQDINGYFSSIAEHKAAAKSAAAARAQRALDADHAANDINGYFSSLSKGKHGANNGHLKDKNPRAAAAAKKVDADRAASDIDGYFSSLAKGKHGANNGHLKDTTSHASSAKVSA